MRTTWCLSLPLAALVTLAPARASAAVEPSARTPAEVRIVLTEGIHGGIVPAVPRSKIEIEARGETVTAHISRPLEEWSLLVPLARAEVDALSREIAPLLDLPVEEPAGGEDIYGFDTSILFERDGRRFQNQGPDSCERVSSSVRPTDEERATFRRAAERIRALIESTPAWRLRDLPIGGDRPVK